jgi:hypothetical protein
MTGQVDFSPQSAGGTSQPGTLRDNTTFPDCCFVEMKQKGVPLLVDRSYVRSNEGSHLIDFFWFQEWG